MSLTFLNKLFGIGVKVWKWLRSPAGKATVKAAEAILPYITHKNQHPPSKEEAARLAGEIFDTLMEDPNFAVRFVKFHEVRMEVMASDKPELKALEMSQVNAAIETAVNLSKSKEDGEK